MSVFRRENKFFITFFICVYLLMTNVCFGQRQTKKELENRKKQLQKEIEYTNELLAETKKNKKLSLTQLVTLNKKISAREELIATINTEIQVLNRQIKQNNESIGNLQKDLAKLKAEYFNIKVGIPPVSLLKIGSSVSFGKEVVEYIKASVLDELFSVGIQYSRDGLDVFVGSSKAPHAASE